MALNFLFLGFYALDRKLFFLSLWISILTKVVGTTPAPSSVRSTINTVISVAGTGTYGSSEIGGPATAMTFDTPRGVWEDSSGIIYVADQIKNCVRKFSYPNGIVASVVGECGASNSYSGDNGPATASKFYWPYGLGTNTMGTVYISDWANYRVRMVSNGIVTTFAGNGDPTYTGDNGPATSAGVYQPTGLWVDSISQVYVATHIGCSIRKISGNTIYLLAGTGTGTNSFSGDGGAATSATFGQPYGVFVGTTGAVYIGDTDNNRIRLVSTANIVTTVMGSGSTSYIGEGTIATASNLNSPVGVVVDASNGDIYSAGSIGNRIQVLTQTSNLITTFAGTGTSSPYVDGIAATSANFNPSYLFLSSDAKLFLTDCGNRRVLAVYYVSPTQAPTLSPTQIPSLLPSQVPTTTPSQSPTTPTAAPSVAPSASPSSARSSINSIFTVAGGSGYTSGGTGGVATSMTLNYPFALWEDTMGVLYVAEFYGQLVRKFAYPNGIVVCVAGTGANAFNGDNRPGSSASLYGPHGVVGDTLGNVYISENGNYRVRKVSDSVISTVAGSGDPGLSYGAAATSSSLQAPYGLWIDSMAVLYVACGTNYAVLRSSTTSGIMTLFAGTGSSNGLFSGDGGAATSAELYDSRGVSGDTTGKVHIADSGNSRIRSVSSGVISTTIGLGGSSYNGENVAATSCNVVPWSAFVDSSNGDIYVASTGGPVRVHVLSGINGLVTTFVGGGSSYGEGGAATSCELQPYFVFQDTTTRLFVAADANNIRVVMYVSPTVAPSVLPSVRPTQYPTSQPSRQPSSRPSRVPSSLPTGQPTSNPSDRPSLQPTRQPSCQPSQQPSCQPSSQPSNQPSIHPTCHPTTQPTRKPSVQPICDPSSQPSYQPVTQPSSQPSRQPSCQPMVHPSHMPTTQPLSRPSRQPSGNPSSQPSNQPSQQPSVKPSCRPSCQPSRQPSLQPFSWPSSQPSSEPSRQPSNQPSAYPTCKPTVQPIPLPTSQPSRMPSVQPLRAPSRQPSSYPSAQPSAHPSISPSTRPSTQPSGNPSLIPSGQPISEPSSLPSSKPTQSPSAAPTIGPSIHPTASPSQQPSTHPSAHPSVQPFNSPSTKPTGQPTSTPSTEPHSVPSSRPTAQPMVSPTNQPTQPPSTNPSAQPKMVPSSSPSSNPSSLPSCQPIRIPTGIPSRQPNSFPSAQPTVFPTAARTNHVGSSLPSNDSISIDGSLYKFKIVIPVFPSISQERANLSFANIGIGNQFGSALVWYGNLSFISTSNALVVSNCMATDSAFRSVSVVEDFNGDGYADLIIGDPLQSKCYVLFGRENGFTRMVQGFTIVGETTNDLAGWTVSDAGDVNNDTFRDLIVGAPLARGVGAVYVIYGSNTTRDLGLNNLRSSEGFVVYGTQRNDYFGISVSNAGDVNNDGYDDVVVGALLTLSYYSGAAFVIFGGSSAPSFQNVADMHNRGARLSGQSYYLAAGFSVGSAGDVNGDGLDDVLVGSFPQRASLALSAFIVYGSLTLNDTVLTSMSFSQGVLIRGGGFIVSGLGDVNSDGYCDVFLGSIIPVGRSNSILVRTDYAFLTANSAVPTAAPSLHSRNPSMKPSRPPTPVPSLRPSRSPTSIKPTTIAHLESESPSSYLSELPTLDPSMEPTEMPSMSPTKEPTDAPILLLSIHPTVDPTGSPSLMPTIAPTTIAPVFHSPSRLPFNIPTLAPTLEATLPPNEVYVIGDLYEVYNDSLSHGNRRYVVNATSNVTVVPSFGKCIYFIVPGSPMLLTITRFNTTVDQIDVSLFADIRRFSDLIIVDSVVVSLYTHQFIHAISQESSSLSSRNFIFSTSEVGGRSDNSESSSRINIIVPVSCVCTGMLLMWLLFAWRKRQLATSAVNRTFIGSYDTDKHGEYILKSEEEQLSVNLSDFTIESEDLEEGVDGLQLHLQYQSTNEREILGVNNSWEIDKSFYFQEWQHDAYLFWEADDGWQPDSEYCSNEYWNEYDKLMWSDAHNNWSNSNQVHDGYDCQHWPNVQELACGEDCGVTDNQ